MSDYETLLRGQEEIKTLYRQQIELAKELKDIINAFGNTYQAGLEAVLAALPEKVDTDGSGPGKWPTGYNDALQQARENIEKVKS